MDSQNISFKAANIRVAAISDTHGRIKRTGDFVAAAAKDSFFKVNKPDSEVNILSIVGDWFMKPGTKGIYKSFADPIGKIQALFLFPARGVQNPAYKFYQCRSPDRKVHLLCRVIALFQTAFCRPK